MLAAIPIRSAALGSGKRFDRSALTPTSELLAGSETFPSESAPGHDAVVAIVSPRGVMCTGVLIAANAVLTAAHCRSGIAVVFGNAVAASPLRRGIARFITAPQRGLDLAIAVLDQGVEIAPYRISDATAAPPRVQVVGFGCLQASNCRTAGRRTYFEALLGSDGWGCPLARSGRYGCAPDHEMVITRSAGADTCTGDSGGPVLARTDSGWAIVAITSRSVRNDALTCGGGGIYVRVQPQLRWIQRVVKAVLSKATA